MHSPAPMSSRKQPAWLRPPLSKASMASLSTISSVSDTDSLLDYYSNRSTPLTTPTSGHTSNWMGDSADCESDSDRECESDTECWPASKDFEPESPFSTGTFGLTVPRTRPRSQSVGCLMLNLPKIDVDIRPSPHLDVSLDIGSPLDAERMLNGIVWTFDDAPRDRRSMRKSVRKSIRASKALNLKRFGLVTPPRATAGRMRSVSNPPETSASENTSLPTIADASVATPSGSPSQKVLSPQANTVSDTRPDTPAIPSSTKNLAKIRPLPPPPIPVLTRAQPARPPTPPKTKPLRPLPRPPRHAPHASESSTSGSASKPETAAQSLLIPTRPPPMHREAAGASCPTLGPVQPIDLSVPIPTTSRHVPQVPSFSGHQAPTPTASPEPAPPTQATPARSPTPVARRGPKRKPVPALYIEPPSPRSTSTPPAVFNPPPRTTSIPVLHIRPPSPSPSVPNLMLGVGLSSRTTHMRSCSSPPTPTRPSAPFDVTMDEEVTPRQRHGHRPSPLSRSVDMRMDMELDIADGVMSPIRFATFSQSSMDIGVGMGASRRGVWDEMGAIRGVPVDESQTTRGRSRARGQQEAWAPPPQDHWLQSPTGRWHLNFDDKRLHTAFSNPTHPPLNPIVLQGKRIQAPANTKDKKKPHSRVRVPWGF